MFPPVIPLNINQTDKQTEATSYEMDERERERQPQTDKALFKPANARRRKQEGKP